MNFSSGFFSKKNIQVSSVKVHTAHGDKLGLRTSVAVIENEVNSLCVFYLLSAPQSKNFIMEKVLFVKLLTDLKNVSSLRKPILTKIQFLLKWYSLFENRIFS